MDKIDVSIIFLTLNGLKDHFEETLEAILNQETMSTFEIIVIDSGSSDGTVEFIKNKSQIKLHEIPNSQFSHSRTRQLGARMAKGKYLVFLTQDATPTNEKWLDNLIRNFDDPEVVGVCSRILPREDAHILKKIEVNNDLSGRSAKIEAQIKDREDFEKLGFGEKRVNYYFFNDISSAIRREYLLENPFPDVNFAEDLEFAKEALNKKKIIVFDPESVVYHSHDYKIGKTYKRNLTDSAYHKKYLNIKNISTLKLVFSNTKYLVKRDIAEMKKYDVSRWTRIRAILYSPLIHFAEQFGQYKGTKV